MNERACGECKACCTAMAVPTIKKATGVPCPHLTDGGCGIYGDHPAECKRFACAWLDCEPDHRNLLRDEDRPDVSGVIITFVGESIDFVEFKRRYGYPPLQAFEVRPGSASQYRGRKVLDRLRRKAIIVICQYDGGRDVIGPDGFDTGVLGYLKYIATRNAQREREEYVNG